MPRVLVVDDIEDNRRLLTRDLEDEGYEVQEAEDGVEALLKVETWAPDAVLMDINMPKMDGIEACRRLKDRPESSMIPVIMLSACNRDSDVVMALDAGAQDYVTKPYVVEVLAARVRVAVASKSAYDTIERMNGHLQELQETAFQFVDNVSHEFRTPLTVIKEFASIIRDGIAGAVTDDQCDYLLTIIDRVDQLALMVDDMLDVSKLEAGLIGLRREECAIGDIVESVRVGIERKAAASGVQLEIDLDATISRVYCDIEKAGRSLLNLAVNAIKFSPEGTVVKIWARRQNAEIVIGVTDCGPGIDDTELGLLFERFRQLGNGGHSSTKGFGLGLNIVRELVDLNLGELFVESRLGHGSTFSFTIPSSEKREIATRYAGWLARQRKGPPVVSLVHARLTDHTTTDVCDVAAYSLRGLLHHPDLALDIGPSEWLLAFGRHDSQLDTVLTRIHSGWDQATADCRKGTLPGLSTDPIGTWQVPDQCEEFLMRMCAHTQAFEATRE